MLVTLYIDRLDGLADGVFSSEIYFSLLRIAWLLPRLLLLIYSNSSASACKASSAACSASAAA